MVTASTPLPANSWEATATMSARGSALRSRALVLGRPRRRAGASSDAGSGAIGAGPYPAARRSFLSDTVLRPEFRWTFDWNGRLVASADGPLPPSPRGAVHRPRPR